MDDRESNSAADWFAAQFGSPDAPAADASAHDGSAHDDSAADSAHDDLADDPAVEGKANTAADDAQDFAGSSHAVESSHVAERKAVFAPDYLATAAPAPDAPTPTAPAQSSGGGFNWGLTPTNAAAQTPPGSEEPSEPAEPSKPAAPAAPAEQAEPTEPFEPAALPEPALPVSPFAPPVSPFAPPLSPSPLVAPPTVPAVALPAAEPEAPSVVPTAEPLPFDAALAGGPSIEAEPPTVAFPWEGPVTELFAPPVASASVAEPATELLGGFGPGNSDAAAGASAEGSPVDALFGDTQFREYQTGSLGIASAPAEPAEPKTPRSPLPRSQKILLWIAGGLVAVLVLVGLFFLGTKLPHAASAPVAVTTPTASAKPSASPTPTQAAPAVGPLAPGEYKWDRLLGGECLAPFTSPWAEKFTVVECATPHPAQMVARGVFAAAPAAAVDSSAPATPAVGDAASSYPGAEVLQAQINLLCTAPTVIDFAAAGAYSDIQILGSYPVTAKQWADGDHGYYCFVTRSSGEPLTTSVAVAHAP